MNGLPTPQHEQENDTFTTMDTAMDVGHYIAIFSRTIVIK